MTANVATLLHPTVQDALLVEEIHTEKDSRGLSPTLIALFDEAKDLTFEDGMDSAFSTKLVAVIERYADAAMNAVIRLYRDEEIAPAVLAETLRWLGQMGFGTSYRRRRWLLEHALFHPSSVVRDGAIVGLSMLEDRQTIPALKVALFREPTPVLRQDIEQLLSDLLESTSA